MTLTDAHHCTWFMASLTSHVRMALSQQKISTQAKALETVMRLNKTSLQDPRLGVQQIQVQIQNFCFKMKKLKQEQATRLEVQEEVWCIKCRSQGHDKDHYPISVNYVEAGGPIPLRPEAQARPSTTTLLWCAICQVGGKHNTNNYHLLPKYNQIPQQLFCNFCRLVGHEERYCHSYQLLMGELPAYIMQTEV